MKQGKIVNVKVKLNRTSSKAEKRKLIELIDLVLDDGTGAAEHSLYLAELREKEHMDSLRVDHHYVTIRKMGRKW
jgi:hypothetical protein